MKRTRYTAGGTACVNNHVESREPEQLATAIQQLRAGPPRDVGDDVKRMTSTPGHRVQAGVDTWVIGQLDEFDGDQMKCVDWSFKLRSLFGGASKS